MDVQTIKDVVSRYAPEYNIILAVLFGSQARGTARSDSDVDIAFLANPRLDTARLANLQTLLSEALGARVDLVDIGGAAPLLLKQIALEGKSVYESTQGAFATVRVQAMMLYFDAKPLLALRKRLTLSPHSV